MNSFKINGKHVCSKSVVTHWSGWNGYYKGQRSFEITLSFKYVIDVFSGYWNEYISREKERDGADSVEGIYEKLQSYNYSDLTTITSLDPVIFVQIVLVDLKVEFLEFVMENQPPKNTEWHFVNGLDAIKIVNNSTVLTGCCSYNDT